MKKRVISVAVAGLLCVTMLSACGDEQPKIEAPEAPELVEITDLPTLSFENAVLEENTLTINTTNASRISLPEYTAKDRFGNEIADSQVTISHSCNGVLDNEIEYKTNANKSYYKVGKHVFVFEVEDPDNKNLKAYYNVYLNVYQNLFQMKNDKMVLENELSDSPTYKSNDTGFGVNFFDMEKGEVYYAEATFDAVAPSDNNGAGWGIGMMHATDTDGKYALKDYYVVSDSGAKWVHKYSYGWNPDSVMHSDYYLRQGLEDPAFSEDDNTIKIAVARVENVFYSFLNDELVDKFVYSGLTDTGSYAGIIMRGDDSSTPYPGKASDIGFIVGDEARAKILALEEESDYYRDFGYARLTDAMAGQAPAAFTENSFEFTTAPSEGDWWQAAVRSNVLLAGKSSVEFDCEVTKAVSGTGTIRMYLKQADGTSDPTNAQGFYNGLQLNFDSGAKMPSKAATEALAAQENGGFEHVVKNTHALTIDGNAAKLHIKIEMEPLYSDTDHTDGKTKFTYTITQLNKNGEEVGKVATFSEFALQDAIRYVTVDEVHDFYYLSFMSGNVKFKVSNLQCTGYKVY